MATAKTSLNKPVFVKGEWAAAGDHGHTMVVKVVSSNMVLQRARPNGTQVHKMITLSSTEMENNFLCSARSTIKIHE